MVLMETTLNLILTVLCGLALFGIIVVSAVLGTRARQKYAAELRKKLDEGRFSNWGKSSKINWYRFIAIIQIANLLGVMFILVMWVSNPVEKNRILLTYIFGILFLISLILGIVTTKFLKK